MSIDEDGGVAARGNNQGDCEDNGDDDDIYIDNGCDLFKVSMATKTMITLRLFNIVVDDGAGDDGIDKTKNNSNDNNHLWRWHPASSSKSPN